MACTCVCPLRAAYCDIIFTNIQVDEKGSGYGNVLTILGVQANPSEYGAVLWNGSSDDKTGDAVNQSNTRTVEQLLDEGIDDTNMTLIFNVNEGGDNDPVLTLHDFDLVFQDASGAELFRESFDAGGGLPLGAAGTGNSASGWRFDVQFTNPLGAAFFGTLTNRVGMEIASGEAIQDTKGAAESFFVTAPIPEPAAIVHGLLGLSFIAAWWLRRRRLLRHGRAAS
ncbi:MAG: hypothetical protein WD063_10365 [Pirellulales bacterium]